jgi:hypothetical protein
VQARARRVAEASPIALERRGGDRLRAVGFPSRQIDLAEHGRRPTALVSASLGGDGDQGRARSADVAGAESEPGGVDAIRRSAGLERFGHAALTSRDAGTNVVERRAIARPESSDPRRHRHHLTSATASNRDVAVGDEPGQRRVDVTGGEQMMDGLARAVDW